MDDLRPFITHELGFQMKRGLIKIIKSNYDMPFTGDPCPSTSSPRLASIFSAIRIRSPASCANSTKPPAIGTLLIVAGKDWATREKRARSMRLFMEQVAPKLRDLEPVREPDIAAA